MRCSLPAGGGGAAGGAEVESPQGREFEPYSPQFVFATGDPGVTEAIASKHKLLRAPQPSTKR